MCCVWIPKSVIYSCLVLILSKGTAQRLPASTSQPTFEVNLSREILITDTDDVADDDNDGNYEDGLPKRNAEDDMLYIILGVVVGVILIGVLVALFICARQQHKQRRLLGTAVLLFGCDVVLVVELES